MRRPRRLVLLAAACLVLAALISTLTHPSNAFALNARTSVVTVEPDCGRQLVWDLPAGVVTVNASDQFPTAKAPAQPAQPAACAKPNEPIAGGLPKAVKSASVQLLAGARARVERVGDGALSIQFDHSTRFAHCAAGAAVVRLESTVRRCEGTEEIELSDAIPLDTRQRQVTIAYYSGSASAAPSGEAPRSEPAEFVLPLEGRVVLGSGLQQGAGWQQGGAAALLDKAEVSVRSRAGWTGRSIGLIDEKIDAGSVVDSAPCFEHGLSWIDRWRLLWRQPALLLPGKDKHDEACARALGAPALGFARSHREGGMEAQLHLNAQHLAIRPHRGEVRLLSVTLWHALTHSHFVQALVAVAVLVGGAAGSMSSLGLWQSEPPRGRRRAARRRREEQPPTTANQKE